MAWHVGIAHAGQNEILAPLMEAISSEILAATDVEDVNTKEVVAAAMKAHDGVITAIDARDPEAARRRMARDVHAHRRSLGAARSSA